jgi:hypothetical protein
MENKVEKGPEARKSGWNQLFIIVTLSLLTSIGTVYIYDQYLDQKIVAFDIRGYMADQKKLFYAGKITEEELLSSLDRLDEFLKKESKKTIILNGDAVIKNAKFLKQ